MRITTFDRLTVDFRSYRLTERTETGCTFESVDAPASTLNVEFRELRELLGQPDVLLERDFFLRERAEMKRISPVDAVGSLPEHIRSVVVWRHAYCEVFLQLEKQGEVHRSERSVAAQIPKIEALVNKHYSAVQNRWRPARAGTDKSYKDPPCARTLLGWVRRFEKAGQSPLGLIPRTHRSGNHAPRFSLEAQRLIGECLGAYLTRQRLSKRIVADMCARRFRTENEKRLADGLPL